MAIHKNKGFCDLCHKVHTKYVIDYTSFYNDCRLKKYGLYFQPDLCLFPALGGIGPEPLGQSRGSRPQLVYNGRTVNLPKKQIVNTNGTVNLQKQHSLCLTAIQST